MPLNLNDARVSKAVKWRVNQVVLFDLSLEAEKIVLNLPKMLMGTPVARTEDKFIYQDILARAKFIALPMLREADVAELIQSNFFLVFELPDYDLWKKFKTKLISMPQFETRDAFKKKVREALLLNEQILTKEKIILGGGEVRGTIKNWLADYHQTLGTGKVETLKFSQYLLNSDNTKNLNAESRGKLDYLLKFYERLKFSSLEEEGIEETTVFNVDGEFDVYEEGRTERVGRDVKEILKRLEGVETAGEIEEELEEKYSGSVEEVKKIEEEKAKILKTTAGDFKKLSDTLFKALSPDPNKLPDKIKVEAILKILAEQGKLEDLLGEKRFSEMTLVYFRDTGKTAESEGFRVNPRAPQYVSAFLQHILKDKVRMSEDESGRLGMQLFNALAKKGADSKYTGFVYFDIENKEFRWV